VIVTEEGPRERSRDGHLPPLSRRYDHRPGPQDHAVPSSSPRFKSPGAGAGRSLASWSGATRSASVSAVVGSRPTRSTTSSRGPTAKAGTLARPSAPTGSSCTPSTSATCSGATASCARAWVHKRTCMPEDFDLAYECKWGGLSEVDVVGVVMSTWFTGRTTRACSSTVVTQASSTASTVCAASSTRAASASPSFNTVPR
jgi:hypothetical protein